MAMGQPLVAPNGVTFPEITGAATNGYPYLFKTVKESKDMIRRMITDKKERAKWGRILSKHVRKHYGRRRWAESYIDLFEGMPKHSVGMSEAAKKKILEGARVNRGKSIVDLYSWLSSPKGHVEGKHTFGTQTMSLTKLARVLRDIGCKTKLVHGEQCVFTKN